MLMIIPVQVALDLLVDKDTSGVVISDQSLLLSSRSLCLDLYAVIVLLLKLDH